MNTVIFTCHDKGRTWVDIGKYLYFVLFQSLNVRRVEAQWQDLEVVGTVEAKTGVAGFEASQSGRLVSRRVCCCDPPWRWGRGLLAGAGVMGGGAVVERLPLDLKDRPRG